jgi:exosome complex exonuclease RRP6
MAANSDNSRGGESLDLTADFTAYKDRVTASLLGATRQANAISSQDLSFHRNSNENFSRSLDRQNAHLLRLTNKLLKAATGESALKAPQIKDQDGVDDNWPAIVDVIDDLLEKADASLDEFDGTIKRQSQSVPDRAQTPSSPQNPVGTRYSQPNHPKIEKPQLLFSRKVDNFDTTPWRPLLTSKPHAIVPLDQSIGNQETG